MCVAGRGDAPVEDTQDDWITFDRTVINARLADLAQHDPHVDQLLSDDIETILIDAYGEAEELTGRLADPHDHTVPRRAGARTRSASQPPPTDMTNRLY